MNDGVRAQLRRIRLSIALLTERRAALFAGADVLFLFWGLMTTLSAGNGSGSTFWYPMFLWPVLCLGVPLMSDAVGIERRAGTLDLALTSPGARLYFERRVGAVGALLVLQGWSTMLLARMLTPAFPLSGPFLQVVVVTLFLSAVTLSWALRLKTPGAVTFATYVTALLFAPWLFSNPVHPPTEMDGPMKLPDYLDYFKHNFVLGVAALIFYLYALQRLSRPERIIQ
jgi:hypothetical protein